MRGSTAERVLQAPFTRARGRERRGPNRSDAVRIVAAADSTYVSIFGVLTDRLLVLASLVRGGLPVPLPIRRTPPWLTS
jgi:hypothetical protein